MRDEVARQRSMRRFSLFRVVFWMLMLPVSWETNWVDSKRFISILSIWALVESAFSAWRSDENPPPRSEDEG